MATHSIVFTPQGTAKTIYSEQFDLFKDSESVVTKRNDRASNVEPVTTPDGQEYWYIDLSNIKGKTLAPYTLRSAAIAKEIEIINDMHHAGFESLDKYDSPLIKSEIAKGKTYISSRIGKK